MPVAKLSPRAERRRAVAALLTRTAAICCVSALALGITLDSAQSTPPARPGYHAPAVRAPTPPTVRPPTPPAIIRVPKIPPRQLRRERQSLEEITDRPKKKREDENKSAPIHKLEMTADEVRETYEFILREIDKKFADNKIRFQKEHDAAIATIP